MDIYDNPIFKILNSETLNVSLKPGSQTRQGCPLSWLVFNTVMLVSVIIKLKEIRTFKLKRKI